MPRTKMTFDEWMAAVDAAIVVKVGLGRDDLPDCPYHDWWEDGVTPKGAATKAIRRANE